MKSLKPLFLFLCKKKSEITAAWLLFAPSFILLTFCYIGIQDIFLKFSKNYIFKEIKKPATLRAFFDFWVIKIITSSPTSL